MQTLTLSTYTLWKQMQAYANTQGKGDVYYTQTNGAYVVISVNLSNELIFIHSIQRHNPPAGDELDFVTNLKSSSTLVVTSDEAVALSLINSGS